MLFEIPVEVVYSSMGWQIGIDFGIRRINHWFYHFSVLSIQLLNWLRGVFSLVQGYNEDSTYQALLLWEEHWTPYGAGAH